MYDDLIIGLYGTIIIWLISMLLAILIGFLFTTGLLCQSLYIRFCVRWLVNISRGVPTSIYVIFGGLLVIKGSIGFSLPAIFPGTIEGFETIAWVICFTLAFGSSGHLAEIFVASYQSLGKPRIEQINAMGFSLTQKWLIIIRECAYIAIPPTSTRMIHHLHNTAFAGLFPVVELFGTIQASASENFRIFEITLIGCVLYILLSGLIWSIFRVSETLLAPKNSTTIFNAGNFAS